MKRILEQWLEDHEQCPYPTPEDLGYLTAVTSLSNKQIRVWFTNYRNVSNLLLILLEEIHSRGGVHIKDKVRHDEEGLQGTACYLNSLTDSM